MVLRDRSVLTLSLLSQTSVYHCNSLGAAGVGGALVYAGLKTFLSPMVTLLIQLVVPVIMFATYLFLLGRPGAILPTEDKQNGEGQRSHDSREDEKQGMYHRAGNTFKGHMCSRLT